MQRRFALWSAVCILATAGSAFGLGAGAPPTDEQVDAAAKTFQNQMGEKNRAAQEKKERLTREVLAETADAAIKDIDLSQASLGQIKKLQESFALMYSTRTPEVSARLAELSKEPGDAGFEAAAMGVSMLRSVTDETAQLALVRTAITHPGMKEALKAGKGTEMFRALGAAKPQVVKQLIPDLLALESAFTSELKPAAVMNVAGLMDVLVDVAPDEISRLQPLRAKLATLVEGARKQPDLDERTTKTLEMYTTKLDGAYMKGTLIGQPVPQMDIIWSNLEPQVKTVADLKGKVVVIDFWATWCGPCIGSFPDVKKLQQHYEGYPVVVLGVTSIQGSFNTGETVDGKAERIDCKGDPDKETGLMPAYIARKDINWKIAFTTQNVFNADFGVNGIPHVAIVDAKGIVRHRGLHPNSRVTPFSDKVAKIDALLAEAGLPTPPPLPKEEGVEKKEATKGG